MRRLALIAVGLGVAVAACGAGPDPASSARTVPTASSSPSPALVSSALEAVSAPVPAGPPPPEFTMACRAAERAAVANEAGMPTEALRHLDAAVDALTARNIGYPPALALLYELETRGRIPLESGVTAPSLAAGVAEACQGGG